MNSFTFLTEKYMFSSFEVAYFLLHFGKNAEYRKFCMTNFGKKFKEIDCKDFSGYFKV